MAVSPEHADALAAMEAADAQLTEMEHAGVPETDPQYQGLLVEHDSAWAVFCLGSDSAVNLTVGKPEAEA